MAAKLDGAKGLDHKSSGIRAPTGQTILITFFHPYVLEHCKATSYVIRKALPLHDFAIIFYVSGKITLLLSIGLTQVKIFGHYLLYDP